MFILSLFFCADAYSQRSARYDLFLIEGDELLWINEYESALNPDSLKKEIVQMVRARYFTTNVVRTAAGYHGEIRNYKVDCKRYGRIFSNTERKYWNGRWTGRFFIEVMDRKYRVTVYGLQFEKPEQTIGHYKSERVMVKYIDVVVKRNKSGFRKSELSNLALMSLGLKDSFDIRTTGTLSEKK